MDEEVKKQLSVITTDIAHIIQRIEIEAMSEPIIDRAKILYLMDEYDEKVLSLDKAIAQLHNDKRLTDDEYTLISTRMDDAHASALRGFKGVKARMK